MLISQQNALHVVELLKKMLFYGTERSNDWVSYQFWENKKRTFLRLSRPSAGRARLDSGDLSVRAVAMSRSLSFLQSLRALTFSSHRNLSRVGGDPELTIQSGKEYGLE